MKIINLTTAKTPSCDACEDKSSHALKFNSLGDTIFMCDNHFNDLKVELDKFKSK